MILSADKFHIDVILKQDSNYYYFIPKYQREYTWSKEQWEALFDDLADNEEGYFIGSIICVNKNDSTQPRLEVIDGQQRLTTICLLLAAIYQEFKQFENNKDAYKECNRIEDMLRCEASNKNGLILVPQEQSNNAEDFCEIMIESGVIDGLKSRKPYFTAHKLWKCYCYFIKRIDEIIENEDDKVKTLKDFKKKVLRSMLVKIEVSRTSDAYVLFESLNNRGIPLTAVDLMKNLIMEKAEQNGLKTDDCYNRWKELLRYLSDDYATQERFFRQYYNAFKNKLNAPFRTDSIRQKDPLGYIATKSNLLDIYEKLIIKDLKAFLDDILSCGQIYSNFIPLENDSSTQNTPLTKLAHIQGAPSYVLLLYLIRNQEELDINDKDISKIINLLTVYFVRRNVTDFPNTRDLTRFFMDMINQIDTQAISGKRLLEFIHGYLKDRTSNDEDFRICLSGDIYKENIGAARFLLCTLAEKHMTTEKWRDLWERKNRIYVWTIEHIFPEGEHIPQDWVNMIANGDYKVAQQLQTEYVHKLGNLTLTGYNSNLGNLSFTEKKDRKNKDGKYIGYRNGLEINKEIANKSQWKIDDIKERTNNIVNELLEIFRFPEHI